MRGRVGILDPVQLTLAQDGIRVAVEAQKGSDLHYALANVSVDLNPAFRLKIGSQ